MTTRLTLTELGAAIGTAVPAWKLRRVVDSLAAVGKITIQRAGLYRTFSADDVGIIADELKSRGAARC